MHFIGLCFLAHVCLTAEKDKIGHQNMSASNRKIQKRLSNANISGLFVLIFYLLPGTIVLPFYTFDMMKEYMGFHAVQLKRDEANKKLSKFVQLNSPENSHQFQ